MARVGARSRKFFKINSYGLRMAWREVSHPGYSQFKGTRVRGYDFSERQDDGGLLGLVLSFETGSIKPVRREIEELTGQKVAITQIATTDGVGAEATGLLEMRMLGEAFLAYLEEEIEFNVNDLTSSRPTGWYRVVFSKTPVLIGDLPNRSHRQKQTTLKFFDNNYCTITP